MKKYVVFLSILLSIVMLTGCGKIDTAKVWENFPESINDCTGTTVMDVTVKGTMEKDGIASAINLQTTAKQVQGEGLNGTTIALSGNRKVFVTNLCNEESTICNYFVCDAMGNHQYYMDDTQTIWLKTDDFSTPPDIGGFKNLFVNKECTAEKIQIEVNGTVSDCILLTYQMNLADVQEYLKETDLGVYTTLFCDNAESLDATICFYFREVNEKVPTLFETSKETSKYVVDTITMDATADSEEILNKYNAGDKAWGDITNLSFETIHFSANFTEGTEIALPDFENAMSQTEYENYLEVQHYESMDETAKIGTALESRIEGYYLADGTYSLTEPLMGTLSWDKKDANGEIIAQYDSTTNTCIIYDGTEPMCPYYREMDENEVFAEIVDATGCAKSLTMQQAWDETMGMSYLVEPTFTLRQLFDETYLDEFYETEFALQVEYYFHEAPISTIIEDIKVWDSLSRDKQMALVYVSKNFDMYIGSTDDGIKLTINDLLLLSGVEEIAILHAYTDYSAFMVDYTEGGR